MQSPLHLLFDDTKTGWRLLLCMPGTSRTVAGTLCGLLLLLAPCFPLMGQGRQAGEGQVYAVVELSFRGPSAAATDSPACDVEFWVRFRHQSGSPEHKVYGFWDGGAEYKARFTPTRAGRWTLAEVYSNRKELAGQRQGDYVVATASTRHGFWIVDSESPSRRWYMRSDGSHQYIVGNTQYSFLSGYRNDNQPSGNDIAQDVAGNAKYFRKLRFTLHSDRYPNPIEKPFLDPDGKPTDSGDYSHRPNPKWFRERGDVAVATAFEHDMIADLILCGPDVEDSRATLRARHNGGDATPWLRYIAARYGSYPNVWICLCNEYDIRVPVFTPQDVARFGRAMRQYLPYPTPMSVHSSGRILWVDALDEPPTWADHQIIQRKIREMPVAADTITSVWKGAEGKGPRNRPTIDDELSYQGEGDRHSEGDTIEALTGAFLGGGYGTTGWKPGNKLGHYFWGKFDPAEHTAAASLNYLRQVIDANITFWKMAPGLSIFSNLDPASRGLAWPGNEYVLGTNKHREGIVAQLPAGSWTVTRYDVVARQTMELARNVSDRFVFSAPDSRAVLFHFRRNAPARSKGQFVVESGVERMSDVVHGYGILIVELAAVTRLIHAGSEPAVVGSRISRVVQRLAKSVGHGSVQARSGAAAQEDGSRVTEIACVRAVPLVHPDKAHERVGERAQAHRQRLAGGVLASQRIKHGCVRVKVGGQ